MTRSHRLDAALPAALVAVPVAAALALADSAREHDGFSAHLDPRVAADALGVRTPLLTHLARLLTFIGSEPVVGGLALLVVIFLLARRGAYVAGCAAAAIVVAAALTVGVKLLVERARPGPVDRLGPVDTSCSFPSGHTLTSTVLLGIVLLLLVPMVRSRGRRVAAAACATALALSIGLSRVYLGYHWASDVIASWLLAVAVLAVMQITVRQRSGSRT